MSFGLGGGRRPPIEEHIMHGCVYDMSSKLVSYTSLLATLDSKCSDEERTTCSGGTIAIRARDSAVSPRVCREAGGADTS